MPSGYQNAGGTDFDDLFEPIQTGDPLADATGYQTALNSDLKFRYAPASVGEISPTNTGYQTSDGTDLRHIFCAKGERILIEATCTPSSSSVAALTNKTCTSDSITCNVTGEEGVLAFQWEFVSGDSRINIDSPTDQSSTFSAFNTVKEAWTATFKCTATDEEGHSASDTVHIELRWT